MKVHSLSSPLPWIVHRGNWKDFRQAFSPLWSYSRKGRGECISQEFVNMPLDTPFDGQPTIGRPFYVQAKGGLWLTCAFYAECANGGS